MTDENGIEYYDCEIKGGDTVKTIYDIEHANVEFYNRHIDTVNSIVKLCCNTKVSNFTIVNTMELPQSNGLFNAIIKKMRSCPNKIFFVMYSKSLSNGYEIGRFFTEHRLFNLLDESDADVCIGCSSMSDITKLFK